MKDETVKQEKKEQGTSFLEIVIDADKDEPDVEDVEEKDFGLSPGEYEAEIAYQERQRKQKQPVLEADAMLITRNIDLERKEDE